MDTKTILASVRSTSICTMNTHFSEISDGEGAGVLKRNGETNLLTVGLLDTNNQAFTFPFIIVNRYCSRRDKVWFGLP